MASIFSAPVPHCWQFLAVLPFIGLRASAIGSCAGFKAVPQPSQDLAFGSVQITSPLTSSFWNPPSYRLSPFLVRALGLCLVFFTPKLRCMLLPMSWLLGNPDE